jgi:hypothetical protein
MAFKAVPGDADGGEIEMVKSICSELENACGKVRKKEDMEGFVENKDVIGLAEAKKSTRLFEQWGYSLRRLVWA